LRRIQGFPLTILVPLSRTGRKNGFFKSLGDECDRGLFLGQGQGSQPPFLSRCRFSLFLKLGGRTYFPVALEEPFPSFLIDGFSPLDDDYVKTLSDFPQVKPFASVMAAFFVRTGRRFLRPWNNISPSLRPFDRPAPMDFVCWSAALKSRGPFSLKLAPPSHLLFFPPSCAKLNG